MSRWEQVQQRLALRSELCKKDIELLERVVDDVDLREGEQDAFAEMLEGLREGRYASLTRRQREWASEVALRIGAIGYENLVSSGGVPVGRPVETPAVLRHLPMKPPGRR
jgi:hypothetical protein